jgi:hypothetical protein
MSKNKIEKVNLNQLVVEGVITKLDMLVKSRTEWQVYYDQAIVNLYYLLAGCLELYHEIKGTGAEKDILKAMKGIIVERGGKVKTNTRVINLIVAYVFNAERQRSFVYARALGMAINNQITSDNFAEWVADFGGIEEISSKGATQETLDKQAELATQVEVVKDMLHAQLKTPLAIVPKTPLLDVASTGEYTLLIGKTLANGETQVLNVIPDATSAMIDMAIKKIAQALINQPELAVKNIKKGGYVDIEDDFELQKHMTLPNNLWIDISEVNEDEYVDVSQKLKSSPESLFQY